MKMNWAVMKQACAAMAANAHNEDYEKSMASLESVLQEIRRAHSTEEKGEAGERFEGKAGNYLLAFQHASAFGQVSRLFVSVTSGAIVISSADEDNAASAGLSNESITLECATGAALAAGEWTAFRENYGD